MARSRQNNKAVCQNTNCSFFNIVAGKDIVRRGTNTARHQRFYCNHCNKYSVETKGTPLYNLKTSERKVKAICLEFSEGAGIRSIERKLKLHRDTICDILDKLGRHAKELQDYLIKDLGLSTLEVDELFATIQKKRKNLTQKEISSLVQVRKSLLHA